MSDLDLAVIAGRISATSFKGRRRLVAITGAPASGKSTIAENLQPLVPASCVVPMDGFHLDNEVLDAKGLRARKGSPATFDVDGFIGLVSSLREADDITYPLFDRRADRAVPDAGHVGPDVETVLVEGNYLMLKNGGWEALQDHWDLTIYLDVPSDELERRLLDRWTSLGLPKAEVEAKTYGNDLPNAKTVAEESFMADLVI